MLNGKFVSYNNKLYPPKKNYVLTPKYKQQKFTKIMEKESKTLTVEAWPSSSHTPSNQVNRLGLIITMVNESLHE